MSEDAVVVLSGGADSTISLFIALSLFDSVRAVTFHYDQKHSVEIAAAVKVASIANNTPIEVINLSGSLKSTSPLLDPIASLETYSDFQEMTEVIGDRVELTFVPMRNVVFLAVAANTAIYYGSRNLVTGICEADGANYPDTTAIFKASMVATIREALGTMNFHIHTPLMFKTKAQSVIEALKYDKCYTALAYSHTAYSGEFPPVTQDHATVLRAQGFLESGYPDPLLVRTYWMGLIEGLPDTHNYMKYEHALHSLVVADEHELYQKLYDLELYFRATL